MRYMVRILVFLFVVPAFAAPAKQLVRGPQPVKDSYIVVLTDAERGQVTKTANVLATKHGARVRHVFKEAFPGFVAQMTEKQATAMLRDRRVASVEQDLHVQFETTQVLPDLGFYYYALDRIDQRVRGFNYYGYQASYTYCQTGAGVKVYVIDTGVWSEHVEFYTNGQSRVTSGVNFAGDSYYEGTATNPCPSYSPNACSLPYYIDNSHGTAVASMIGGNTYGVAKGVTIVPLRVTNCYPDGQPPLSRILQALETVALDHQPGQAAVVNMSLSIGGDYNDYLSMSSVIQYVLNDGVPVVAAAGNALSDAGSFMPGNIGGVITVGGSNAWDERWVEWDGSFGSNWGNTIDLFAPAFGIAAGMWSCDANGNAQLDPTAIREHGRAGTSFSAAYVTGVVAQYMQAYPNATPAQVESWLINNATAGALNPNNLGSPNRLLFTNCL